MMTQSVQWHFSVSRHSKKNATNFLLGVAASGSKDVADHGLQARMIYWVFKHLDWNFEKLVLLLNDSLVDN